MSFEQLSESELRALCRRHLDALEGWLRRLIADRFQQVYGNDPVSAQVDVSGEFRLKKELRLRLSQRLTNRPNRYSRAIDAADFADLRTILCNPVIYKDCFKPAFETMFPLGFAHLELTLSRLQIPRNHLAHQNPISVRQAEQVVCYCGDIVESLRSYYKDQEMTNEYDIPTFIRGVDSFGIENYPTQTLNRGQFFNYSLKSELFFRPGDHVWWELTVDPNYDPADWHVVWTLMGLEPVLSLGSPTRFDFRVEEKHIMENLHVEASLITNRSWHRHLFFDDRWTFFCKVLPRKP